MTRGIVISAILCLAAHARTPEGPLGALILPNDGRPAIITAGGSFDVVVARKGELSIDVGDELRALPTEWGRQDKAGLHARCTVPADTPDGQHTVAWSDGADSDRTQRALFVQKAMPAQYVVACIGAPELAKPTSKNKTPSNSNWVKALNDSEAAFGVIFAPEDDATLAVLISEINGCTKPTYVLSASAGAVSWFGPNTFGFSFAKDNFVAPGVGRTALGDTYGDAVNTYAKISASPPPDRWTVCLLPYFDAAISMRNVLTLFVDRPFDAVLCGSADQDHPDSPKKIAWTGWFPPTVVYRIAPGQSSLLLTQNSDAPFKVLHIQS